MYIPLVCFSYLIRFMKNEKRRLVLFFFHSALNGFRFLVFITTYEMRKLRAPLIFLLLYVVENTNSRSWTVVYCWLLVVAADREICARCWLGSVGLGSNAQPSCGKSGQQWQDDCSGVSCRADGWQQLASQQSQTSAWTWWLPSAHHVFTTFIVECLMLLISEKLTIS